MATIAFDVYGTLINTVPASLRSSLRNKPLHRTAVYPCSVSYVMMFRKIEGLESIQGYRIMKLAIKKPKAVFWKTGLSVEDIQKMLQAGKITEEWLVCPQGEVGDAVLISEFLANPSIFESILKSNSPEKKDESETEPNQKNWNVLLPCWALAYFPIVFLVGSLLLAGDPFGGYYVFVFSGVALLVLTPIYAVAIGILTVKRIKNDTNTIKITLFQIFPLIVYIHWLVAVLSFGGSPV